MKKRNKFEMKVSRRKFLKIGFAGGAAMFIPWRFNLPKALAEPLPGGMDPTNITKFVTPMLIPPVMPKAGVIKQKMGKNIDYYEISMKQFKQQILPAGMPETTVWGYGSVNGAGSKRPLLLHNAPSLTIEANRDTPIRIKWINDLKDASGSYLSHLLPVDQTLHWANPPGGNTGRDTRPDFTELPTPGSYTGPVPMCTHVHGAVGVGDESDGYAEAWYLPDAGNIPGGYATEGTWYDFFKNKAAANFGETWGPGYATFQYPNENRASTIWYHDHTLGMTRLNVYAGPAGFFLLRGKGSSLIDSTTGIKWVPPGPAPKDGDMFPPNKTYYEIPIAIQDRSFNDDGSLFYPDTREFFDEIVGDFIPDGEFSPIWNPEFFGNTMMVNGNTWPYQVVEKRRYRFRFLNGCQSRFLILDFNDIPGVEVWQIGNDGGYLTAPVNLTETNGNRLLMGLAERADVIVDFTNVPENIPGEGYVLANVGPDEPFGGGEPVLYDDDPPPDPGEGQFLAADPNTTRQIMQFRVVPAVGPDPSTPPENLVAVAEAPLPPATVTRKLALIEKMGEGVDTGENPVEGPIEALLGRVVGTLGVDAEAVEDLWMDAVTENPAVGTTEVWEFYNTTGDAHPMHVHEVAFEVVNREGLVLDADGEVFEPITLDGNITLPEPWETGRKDTVIAYPGQVTRIRAQFNTPGQFVWHCHIVEHEDNEMMRPFRIGPVQGGQPGGM